MAIYRNVQMSFWTDTKVLEEFSADERLLYIFLLTSPKSNLAGCYEITPKQVNFYTGIKNAKAVLDSLAAKNVIAYSEQTKEVLVVNWAKYNWTNSEKFRKPLLNEIKAVKNKTFQAYLMSLFNGEDVDYDTVSANKDTVSDNGGYRTDTTVSVTDPVTVSNVNTEKESKKTNIYIAERVIAYLNEKTGSKYRLTSSHQSQINARLKEGYSEQDFFTVIDNKVREWKGTEREKYLRPETLFGTKFDSYLNVKQTVPLAAEAQKPKPKQNAFNSFENQHEYNWDELAKTLSHYPVADTG